MTLIKAINIMLSTIGEAPVNTIDSGYVEASLAQTILEEVSAEVQSKGFSFNTEAGFEILPDTVGEINLPSATLKVDPVQYSDNYVQRGLKLYDKDNKTFVFTEPVELDLVIELDFEDLPQVAQQYIVVRSARKFQSRLIGNQTLFAYTEREEQEALYELKNYELETNDYNMLDNTNLIDIN